MGTTREIRINEQDFYRRLTFTVTVFSPPRFRVRKWIALRLIQTAVWLYGSCFDMVDNGHDELRRRLGD